MKTLVLYYSYENNTEFVAKLISNQLDATLQRVIPIKEMKTKGFGKFVWGGRQVFMGTKPEIVPLDVNIDDYDVVFVGSPIWAGTYTPPIKTILENEYIKNKKVIYFYTHQGGCGKAEAKAQPVIEADNTFIAGKDFLNPLKNQERIKTEVKTWLEEITKKLQN